VVLQAPDDLALQVRAAGKAREYLNVVKNIVPHVTARGASKTERATALAALDSTVIRRRRLVGAPSRSRLARPRRRARVSIRHAGYIETMFSSTTSGPRAPSQRAYLQGQIVGACRPPLAQLTGLFQAPFQNLVHVLTARAN